MFEILIEGKVVSRTRSLKLAMRMVNSHGKLGTAAWFRRADEKGEKVNDAHPTVLHFAKKLPKPI